MISNRGGSTARLQDKKSRRKSGAGTQESRLPAAKQRWENPGPAASGQRAGRRRRTRARLATKKTPARSASKPRRNRRKKQRRSRRGNSEGQSGRAAYNTVSRRFERAGSGGGALDPFEVAKQTMKGSVPAIVEAMVERAKQGSCTHAKTLLEMTGAKHMFDERSGDGREAASPGRSWCWNEWTRRSRSGAEERGLGQELPQVASRAEWAT